MEIFYKINKKKYIYSKKLFTINKEYDIINTLFNRKCFSVYTTFFTAR